MTQEEIQKIFLIIIIIAHFNGNTQELIMIKHGWEPFLTTQNPICGPTRKGGYFTFGRYVGKKRAKDFKKLIKMGKKKP